MAAITKARIDWRLTATIAFELDISQEKVTHDARFTEDLGADSLDAVNVVTGVEEEFNVEIPDEDAAKLHTVGAMLDYLHGRAGELR